jgi:hypothetical protein
VRVVQSSGQRFRKVDVMILLPGTVRVVGCFEVVLVTSTLVTPRTADRRCRSSEQNPRSSIGGNAPYRTRGTPGGVAGERA